MIGERDKIVVWLIEKSPDIESLSLMPVWRVYLWALLHPIRFAVAAETARIATAIYQGEHREG